MDVHTSTTTTTSTTTLLRLFKRRLRISPKPPLWSWRLLHPWHFSLLRRRGSSRLCSCAPSVACSTPWALGSRLFWRRAAGVQCGLLEPKKWIQSSIVSFRFRLRTRNGMVQRMIGYIYLAWSSCCKEPCWMNSKWETPVASSQNHYETPSKAQLKSSTLPKAAGFGSSQDLCQELWWVEGHLWKPSCPRARLWGGSVAVGSKGKPLGIPSFWGFVYGFVHFSLPAGFWGDFRYSWPKAICFGSTRHIPEPLKNPPSLRVRHLEM